MKIINDLPSMGGTFLNPKTILSDEWKILKDEDDVILVLEEPSSAAMAFKVWPKAKFNVKKIVYAGGTLDRGDATPYAEKSIYNDPEAMESLLNTGITVVFCTLEEANKRNMSVKELANDYANNPSKYETIECGVHIEIQKASKAYGKMIADYMADHKFEKKNALIFK